MALPVAFELVRKTETRSDPKTGQTKRYSAVTKNQHARSMLGQCVRNGIPFRYVLGDSWYASAENLKFIKHQFSNIANSANSANGYDFVMPLKSNRKVALSRDEQQSGHSVSVETLMKEQIVVREVWLEGVDFPMLLVKQVFTNEDGSTGILYLVSSDTTLTSEAITSLYQRRWKVEEYHKSLKQNASLAKSPTRTVTTQTNHFFASLYAYIKLQRLKLKTSLNHFALKTKIYVSALHSAFVELQRMQTNAAPAA